MPHQDRERSGTVDLPPLALTVVAERLSAENQRTRRQETVTETYEFVEGDESSAYIVSSSTDRS